MQKLIIKGPTTLNGTVQMSCSKNAYLPIMAGILLCEEPVVLKDMPPCEICEPWNDCYKT